MSKVVDELAYLVKLLSELGIPIHAPVALLCNSRAVIHITKNLKFHERTKHIKVYCHFIGTKLTDGLISLSHILTSLQLADILPSL